MTMGERIKLLRKKHEMTMEELGIKIGVGKSAILKYEKGEVENIPRSGIVEMAKLFDVSPEYILAFSDDEKMGFMSDSMIKEYIINKFGEETYSLFERISSMTKENRDRLFGLCDVIEKSEKYDQITALTNR